MDGNSNWVYGSSGNLFSGEDAYVKDTEWEQVRSFIDNSGLSMEEVFARFGKHEVKIVPYEFPEPVLPPYFCKCVMCEHQRKLGAV